MIQIDSKVCAQMETLVENIKTEVAGLLLGEIDKDGQLFIDELIIPDQEASTGDVDFKEEDMITIREELGDERWKRVMGHWHSHLAMGVFWSSTDDKLIEAFSRSRKKSVFIVSSLKNGNFELKGRIVLREPLFIDVDDVPINVINTDANLEEFLTSAKTKIRKPVYNPKKDMYGTTLGWGQNYGYDERDNFYWKNQRDYSYDNVGKPLFTNKKTPNPEKSKPCAYVDDTNYILSVYNVTPSLKKEITEKIKELNNSSY